MRGLGVPSFDAQTRALRVARDVLLALLRDDRPPSEDETELIAREVLPAVRLIDRGIGLTERAERLDPVTTRDLLRRAGLRFEPRTAAERMAAERAGHPPQRGTASTCRRALPSLRHARVVFALIPRLPEDLVTWPVRGRRRLRRHRRPIGDRQSSSVWRTRDRALAVAAGHRIDPDEHLRRTYAFCDTSGWLDLSLVRR
jgi:hypothetical protein